MLNDSDSSWLAQQAQTSLLNIEYAMCQAISEIKDAMLAKIDEQAEPKKGGAA
jgi:hypothetical protein